MSQQPQSPEARRLRPPSWLDVRLVIGVLMVLVAVLVGARVVASSDKSTKVWALARDVSDGTRLADGDLRQERIRLFGDGERYLSTTTSPVGRTVNRDLRSGDLLPGAALVDSPAGVVLPLSVSVDDAPPALGHGDRIDVYVIPGSSDQSGRTQQVLADAVVQSVSGLGGSGLAADNSKAQITVTIPPAQEDRVVKRIAAGTLYVVQRVGPGSDDSPATAPETAVPSTAVPSTAVPSTAVSSTAPSVRPTATRSR